MTAARVYAKGERWRLWLGDCRDVLAGMEAGSVDAVVTDIPYSNTNQGTSRASVSAGIPNETQFFEAWARQLLAAVTPCLSPQAAMWTTVDWRGAVAFENATRGSALNAAGIGVWDRGGLGMGYALRHVYECFVLATMPEWKRKLTDETDVWHIDWFPSSRSTGHEAEKPVELGERALRLIAPPADGVVVDPFAGSGSLSVAAVRCGFRAVAVEREERYCEIAARRLRAVEAQGVLPLPAAPASTAEQQSLRLGGKP